MAVRLNTAFLSAQHSAYISEYECIGSIVDYKAVYMAELGIYSPRAIYVFCVKLLSVLEYIERKGMHENEYHHSARDVFARFRLYLR